MASTLIIGIGTTGLRIIEEAQQFHYEFTGKNKPDGNVVEYLYLETDISKKPAKTASGKTDIQPVYLDLTKNEAIITQLKNNTSVDSDWIPEAADVLSQGNGAGGMSSYGRLALWGVSNYTTTQEKIRAAYNRINGNLDTKIFIVGSLTGGTGSGLCVDIAYLVREITSNENIEAIFLLPDYSIIGKNSTLFENTFGALAALDYYSRPENNYKVKMLDGEKSSIAPPYQYIQYISQDFYDATASISNLPELIRIAGLSLVINFFDVDKPESDYFKGLINARRVDSKSHDRIGVFNSLGIKLIQYPKSQIEELISIKFSKEIIEQWVDPEFFIDKHSNKTAISLITKEVERSAQDIIETIIDKSFQRMESATGPDNLIIGENVNHNIQLVLNNNTGASTNQKYIFDLFSTKNASQYFAIIKSNSIEFRNVIIDELYEVIKLKTNEFKNLNITHLLLKEMANCFSNIIDFWKKEYRITGNDADWDQVLKSDIEDLFIQLPKYKLLLQREEYYKYRLNSIILLIKMHAIIPELKAVIDSINTGEKINSTKNTELPTLKLIEKHNLAIKNTIDSKNDNQNLKSREDFIKNDLLSSSSCFYRVYQKGSLDKDLQEVIRLYNQSNKKINYEVITDNRSIWDYLSDTNNDIYTDCIKNSIQFIQINDLLEKVDIISIIDNIKPGNLYNERLLKIVKGSESNIKKETASPQ